MSITHKELNERIEYLESRQELLIEFIYEIFCNHPELINKDDLSRLNAVMKF